MIKKRGGKTKIKILPTGCTFKGWESGSRAYPDPLLLLLKDFLEEVEAVGMFRSEGVNVTHTLLG